jgi:hypothetical protein
MNQLKPILFVDYNKVISYKNFWFSLEDPDHELHEELSKIEEYLFRNNIALVKEWMVGKQTTESVHKLISENTNIDYDTLLQTFIKDCKNLDAPEKILNAMELLKDKYIRVLRTDNMDSFTRFTLPANDKLKGSFEEVDNSFELQELKTDNNGQYFIKKAKEYGVDITSCILIDDAEKNCVLFESLGGKAYHVTGVDKVHDTLVDLA